MFGKRRPCLMTLTPRFRFNMAKKYDNWYVSKVDVSLNAEGRLEAAERVLTAPEASKSKREGRRLAALTMSRMKALGIENLHLCPPDHKRYSKLLREQNKRNKVKKMTKADVAAILADDIKEENNNG